MKGIGTSNMLVPKPAMPCLCLSSQSLPAINRAGPDGEVALEPFERPMDEFSFSSLLKRKSLKLARLSFYSSDIRAQKGNVASTAKLVV